MLDQQGTSWIELYARFNFLEGQVADSELLLEPERLHINFSDRLKLFINSSRELFSQQGSKSLLAYTSPCRVSQLRLNDYCIPYFVPCLRLILCLTPGSADSLHSMLTTLRPPGKAPAQLHKAKALKLPKNSLEPSPGPTTVTQDCG